ncbi:MAG: Beta-hexosaminidase [Chlamydiales bacterium]|nr:Beta-hexosaminidase [Chlamydiales bacterium]
MKRILLLLLLFVRAEAFDLSQMTVEEKVGQMFMAYFDGHEANESAQRLLSETKIGGIILYNWANGLTNPYQVRQLCADLQELAAQHVGIPLLIAADQEGGVVTRFENGFTEFPGNTALGRTRQPELACEVAQCIGKELKCVGVNFNLAPVVDIHNNPVIGLRSFGEDPESVTQFGKASIGGYQNAGLLCCLKHFPGLGDAVIDPHRGLPVVTKSLEELLACELYPYEKLARQVPAIMTGHVLFPQIDPENCATLSSRILQDILRDRIQFEGVLITDSLTMEGVQEGYETLEGVALQALEAGNDILLIGGRDLQARVEGETHVDAMIQLFRYLVSAVKAGEISEERVDASVRRVLQLKEKMAWIPDPTQGVLDQTLRCADHLKLAREVAYRSLCIKQWDLKHGISDKTVAVIAPKMLERKLSQSDLKTLGSSTALFFFDMLNPSKEEQKAIIDAVEDVDVVVFCSYNAWRFPEQLHVLNALSRCKPTICVASRDPYELNIEEHSLVKIATYSPTTCAFQAVAEWLQGCPQPFPIEDEEIWEIGKKIWYNECRNRTDQLTFWHRLEPFPSFGIGHFIWPPEGYEGIFSGGRFHHLVGYLVEQGVEVPSWMRAKSAPWQTREEFCAAYDTARMHELRDLLIKTTPLQARYMVERLNTAFYDIILAASPEERQSLTNRLFSVGRTDKGPYVLVDYLNFKHEGTDPQETYNGQGWGLLQVLREMQEHETQLQPEQEFAEAAKRLLMQRIANSPTQEVEESWFPGWVNRLGTYYSN